MNVKGLAKGALISTLLLLAASCSVNNKNSYENLDKVECNTVKLAALKSDLLILQNSNDAQKFSHKQINNVENLAEVKVEIRKAEKNRDTKTALMWVMIPYTLILT